MGGQYYRPKLEALERREVLDAYLWRGGANPLWGNLASWQLQGGGAPMRLPDQRDDITFDNQSGDCLLAGMDPVTVKSLNSTTDNTGDLYISGELTVAGNGLSQWRAKDIYLDEESYLIIATNPDLPGSHIFEWIGGEIVGTGTYSMVLIVEDGVLYVEDNANSISADIVVGLDYAYGMSGAQAGGFMSSMSSASVPSDPSAGKLVLTNDMDYNLTLKGGASIFISSQGTMEFQNVGTQLTAPGGVVAETSASEITCYGTMRRNPVTANQTTYVPVVVKTTLLDGAELLVNTNSEIRFKGSNLTNEDYDLYVVASTVKLYSGAWLVAASGISYESDSELVVAQDPQVQNPANVRIYAYQYFSASTIRWESGVFIDLELYDDLEMYFSSTLIQNVRNQVEIPNIGKLRVVDGSFTYGDVTHVLNVTGNFHVEVSAIEVSGNVSGGEWSTEYPMGWSSYWNANNHLRIVPPGG
jgi:hypothetical protein